MKKSMICSLAILTLLGITVDARAEFHPFKLLRRGFTNILTAPLEIPKQTIASVKEGHDKTYHVSAWAFTGFIKGIAYTAGRMGSGMFDVLTSNFDRNGDPLMNPEYVTDDWPSCAGATTKSAKEESASTDNAAASSQK